MTVTITGGCGFVGLAIAEALLASGREVLLVDRRPPSAAAARTFDRLAPGRWRAAAIDTRDAAALATQMRAAGTTGLFHAATVTSGPVREAEAPDGILDVNLVGFARVLTAARDAGVARCINVSSASAYGPAAYGDTPVDEATPVDPDSLYSITKFASERVTRRLAGLWGRDMLSVRLTSVFGPWEADTGVRDTPSPFIQVACAALAGRPALLPRDSERDWTYSRDIARSLVALLDAPTLDHDLYNVSCGRRWSLVDGCRRLAATAAPAPGFACRVAAAGEAPTVTLNAGRDRQPLVVDRLRRDVGAVPPLDLDAAFADFRAWIADCPDYWGFAPA